LHKNLVYEICKIVYQAEEEGRQDVYQTNARRILSGEDSAPANTLQVQLPPPPLPQVSSATNASQQSRSRIPLALNT
jgi:hypothetical protein